MPWRIYRPSMVIGHSETGAMDKVDGPYYFFPILKVLRDLLPSWTPLVGVDLGDTNVVPVDYVAKAMDHLAHLRGPRRRGLPPRQPRAAAHRRRHQHVRRGRQGTAVRDPDRPQRDRLVPTGLLPRRAPPRQPAQGRAAHHAGPARRSRETVGRLGLPPRSSSTPASPRRTAPASPSRPWPAPASRCRSLESYAAASGTSGRSSSTTRSPATRRTVAALERQDRRDHRRLVGDRQGDRVQGRAGGRRPGARGPGQGQARGHQCRDRGARRHRPRLPVRPLRPRGDRRPAERLTTELDSIDFLVNNAGRSIRRSVKLSHDRFHDFERTMQLNYFGAIRLVMGLLPTMREQKRGHVVNISSIGVQTSPPRFSAYVASKAALDAWSNVVALRGGRRRDQLHLDPHAAGEDADDRADEDLRQVPDDQPGAGRRDGGPGARRPAARDQHDARHRRRDRPHAGPRRPRSGSCTWPTGSSPTAPLPGARPSRWHPSRPTQQQLVLARLTKGVHW